MKKTTFIIILLILSIVLNSCSGWFGYEKYTDTEDYSKIFELPEIRSRAALALFPQSIENMNVQEFYFEWKLGIVGSADIQFLLSIKYKDDQLQEEITRLRSLADGKIVYDTQNFAYDAYVLVLGYNSTNYYALIDGNTVHYILLQIIYVKDIVFDRNLLPKGYQELGDVKGISYSLVGF